MDRAGGAKIEKNDRARGGKARREYWGLSMTTQFRSVDVPALPRHEPSAPVVARPAACIAALLGSTCLSGAGARLALATLVTAGVLLLTPPAHARVFDVGNHDQLYDAVNAAQNGDVINFTANITLTRALQPVRGNVTIEGNNFSLSGNNQWRGLFVESGTVAINNLQITNTLARGGNGGTGTFRVDPAGYQGTSSGGGGGGAGMGGALYVGDKADVTISNVTLNNSRAIGGAGGDAVPRQDRKAANGGGGSRFGAGGDDGSGAVGGGGRSGEPGTFGGGGGGSSYRAGAGGYGGGGGGGGGNDPAALGGFGGGKGGNGVYSDANVSGAGGGGGAGLGGAIFVMEGGKLNVAGPLNLSGNSVAGGRAGVGQLGRGTNDNRNGTAGAGYGANSFLQGSGSFSVSPAAGQTQAINSGDFVDEKRAAGSGGVWSLVKNGAGTTILTGSAGFSGATSVNAGMLRFTSQDNFAAGQQVTLNGGAIGLAAGAPAGTSIDRGLILQKDGIVDNAQSLIWDGVISGSGKLIKSGDGDLTLTRANTYSGGTLVTGDSLLVQNNGNLGAAGSGIVLKAGTFGLAAGSSAQTIDRPITIDGLGGLTSSNGSPLTLSGVISGTRELQKLGNGDVTLSGANTFTANIYVADGVLRFANGGSNFGNASNTITLIGGSVGSSAQTPNGTVVNRSLSLNQQGGIDVANALLTWAGDISGVGRFVKAGAGDLFLTGNNTYSGGTLVTGGVLRFNTQADMNKWGTNPTITLNGGSIGNTRETPAATSINRNIIVEGAGGGINVALHPLTWAGNISGDGKFVKSGDGELELTGTNTYSGGTLIERGALRVASDDKLGAAGTGITINNNGSLRAATDFTTARSIALTGAGGVFQVDDGKTMTLNGVVSGTNLTKVGAGTLMLGARNTYSGTNYVNGGALQGNADTIRGNIVFDSNKDNTIPRSVVFQQATNGTFAGSIQNIGSVVKIGAGELLLTGSNSYSGGTFVTGGTLRFNTAANLGATDSVITLNGGRLGNTVDSPKDTSVGQAIRLDGKGAIDVKNNLTWSGAISGSGHLDVTGSLTLTGNNTYSGGTTILDGILRGTSNGIQGNILTSHQNTFVSFDQADAGTYAGVISGPGTVAKFGTGKLTITGVQAYTGPTYIHAGNLSINGSLESSKEVNVQRGGTLSGNGKLGNVINNGGTISPGNSIGTLQVNGDLTMAASSEYYVEINGTKSDLIQVAGSANILSSTFRIGHDTDQTSAPVLPGKTYTILTTGGGLANTSPTIGIADFPFLNFALHGDGFNATLTTSRGAGAFAELASTANEKAVAGALDAAGLASPLWQQVVGSTEAQARAAFTSLGNASIHANAAGVLSEQSQYLRDAVIGRLRQDFAYGTSLASEGAALSYSPDVRDAYAADKGPFHKVPPMATPVPALTYAIWAQGFGSWGTLKGDGNAARTDHSLGGIVSGLDATFNGQWRIGLAGGYSNSTFRSPGISASGLSDSYHVALYGGGQVGNWGIRGGASFSWNDITTTRQAAVVRLAGTQRGDYTASTTQAFGEVGHGFAFAGGTVEPFANLAYVRVNGGVNEFGIAATTGSMHLDTVYTTLGVRGAMALTDALTARGTLGWRHAFGDITPVAMLALQSGGPAFALAGSPIARDGLVAEAGLDFAVARNISLGVSWTGQFANGSRSNTVKGNFSWRF